MKEFAVTVLLNVVASIAFLIIELGLVYLFGFVDPNGMKENFHISAILLNIACFLTLALAFVSVIDISFRDTNGKFQWF